MDLGSRPWMGGIIPAVMMVTACPLFLTEESRRAASEDAPRGRILVFFGRPGGATRLSRQGFAVCTAHWGDAPRCSGRCRAAAAVLCAEDDVAAAIETCRALRSGAATRDLPILVELRAVDAIPETVLACFAAGADDCVTDGGDTRVLAAQVAALIRRYERARRETERRMLATAGLRLDYDTWSVIAGRRRARLTPKEFSLLEALMRRTGAVVSRRELMGVIRRSFEDTTGHTLDTHIANLRAKLGPGLGRRLQTVAGVGYLLKKR